MTLGGTILKKVQSTDTLRSKYPSPPPEHEQFPVKKRKIRKSPYSYIPANVDTRPPKYDARRDYNVLPDWRDRLLEIYGENLRLLMSIKRAHFARGKVDSHWDIEPKNITRYYEERVNFLKRVQMDNSLLHTRLTTTIPKVVPTECLRRDWVRNRKRILDHAQFKFVLFPPVPEEYIEDPAFITPPGVSRPRVQFTLRIQDGAEIGQLSVELFSDVCPNTCKLFLELLDGDGLGHGYVGTRFFRKVPNLFWSGGDVIYDNGFGCYAQRGRRCPIGAENYHFSHSMPGLLSMRMTPDDEMCGSFNITFKPLPQFDLRNVVFGRIIRPCGTYDSILQLGSPLSVQPVVRITSSRRRQDGVLVCGQPNTKLDQIKIKRFRRSRF